jgi:hypothetical protein
MPAHNGCSKELRWEDFDDEGVSDLIEGVDDNLAISLPASYLDVVRCSPPPPDPPLRVASSRLLLPKRKALRAATVVAANTSLGSPVVVGAMHQSSSLAKCTMGGRLGKRPLRLCCVTLDILKGWKEAASLSISATGCVPVHKGRHRQLELVIGLPLRSRDDRCKPPPTQSGC